MARCLAITAVLFVHFVKSAAAAENEGCTQGGAHSDAACAATSASLLQKVAQRDGKNVLAEGYGAPACTGVATQGKCWYFSEMGESCSATCAKRGRRFSYIAADGDQPLTPKLLGQEPRVKQEPWAAFECYVPSEDRYHIAAANAAIHQEDIGAWSYESCKLACPCGEADDAAKCKWEQPPACASEFEWKGVTYSGCLSTVDQDKPWCMNKRRGGQDDWSYCRYRCGSVPEAPKPKDDCKWIAAPSCVKEFDYAGAHYVGCTATNLGTPWCSNSDPYTGSWSHCVDTCTDQPPTPDGQLCTWKPKPACATSFVYKDVEYTGCIEIDHPTPWCSHDRTHKGFWSTCEQVCKTAQPTAQPTAAPKKPSGGDAPCDRHPDVENDAIGELATLDEAGYKIAAAAATADSPINMKRFVCRTASKLNCKVVELSALMAFVPYYSGTVARQTYAHLESELSTLCHAGGKWIVPSDKA